MVEQHVQSKWAGIHEKGEWGLDLSRKLVRTSTKPTPKSGEIFGSTVLNSPIEEPTAIWLNPELEHHDATANLDDQIPATLYYLGLVKDIPEIVEIFVELFEDGRRKHWTVLNKRDYDAMDDIYSIEENVLSRFPMSNISFRVTIAKDDGPSVSNQAVKIFNAK